MLPTIASVPAPSVFSSHLPRAGQSSVVGRVCVFPPSECPAWTARPQSGDGQEVEQ